MHPARQCVARRKVVLHDAVLTGGEPVHRVGCERTNLCDLDQVLDGLQITRVVPPEVRLLVLVS